MISKFRIILATAVLFSAAAACSDSNSPDLGMTASHVSRMTGRVVSPAGVPLDSVEVAAVVERPGYGYIADRGFTNANGEFSYEVRRLYAPRVVAQPDTVHAQVLVKSIRQRDIVNGQAPVGTGSTVLTFVPRGQASISNAPTVITLVRSF